MADSLLADELDDDDESDEWLLEQLELPDPFKFDVEPFLSLPSIDEEKPDKWSTEPEEEAWLDKDGLAVDMNAE